MFRKPTCPLVAAATLFAGGAALVLDTGRWDWHGDQQLAVRRLVSVNDSKECLGGWNAINPSFARVPGSTDIAVAFRGLCVKKTGPQASWFSKMVVGRIPVSEIRSESRASFAWKSLAIAPDLRFSYGVKGWSQCLLPDVDHAEGAEDPRFVQTPGGLYAIVTGYSLVHEAAGPHPCGERGMLLHAAKVKSIDPPLFYPSKELVFEGMSQIEKNWAMFTPPSSTGSTVHAVYSVYPHKIASIDLASGKVKFIANTYSPALVKLAMHMGMRAQDFHGGGGVAYVKSGGEEYFLSVAHVIVHRSGGYKDYWNFPYKFQAQKPYTILHVGKKLDLKRRQNPAYTASWVAFVTTVMYDQGDVFIGYGSGDRSSRTVRIPLTEFDAKHFPSSPAEEEFLEAFDVDARLAETVAFGRVGFTDEALNSTNHGCRDDMTPSICRSLHRTNDTDRLSEDVNESSLDILSALEAELEDEDEEKDNEAHAGDGEEDEDEGDDEGVEDWVGNITFSY